MQQHAFCVSVNFSKFLQNIYSDNLCPFLFLAVPVSGRCSLWSFRLVTVPKRFVAFWFVAVPVCDRFDFGHSGLWPF